MLRNLPRGLRWLRIPYQIWQRTLHVIARSAPGAETLRVWLHRARGVRIKGKVFIGANVYIDDEYPECVTLNDNTVIGISCIIITHFRGKGTVEIGPDAFVGPGSIILPNVHIGEGAVVTAGSVVTRDVPAYTLVGGNPEAKPMARVTKTLGRRKSYDDFQRGLRPLRKGD
ncbi:MAG: acyltransferase [Candidatus Krumholzibacteriota bacterium]|nr:acyltransferase [Candidatus Krumholzibacteriota bacterium]